MTEEELDAILASRGYERIASPDPQWRAWLWVRPIREHAIATKLCQKMLYNLSESGIHGLLDRDCELKTKYYTDEDRKHSVYRMSLQAKPYTREEAR